MAVSVHVECYAGYRGEETPRRIYLNDRRIEVVAVSDRWLGPDHRYFKVEGDDGHCYVLRHDSETLQWALATT